VARNLRASGQGRLLVGKRSESFTATELGDDEKAPVLRAYLKRWKFEVGVFFDGVGPDSSEDELRGAAPKHRCSGWPMTHRERNPNRRTLLDTSPLAPSG